jgi:hypothetical protein
LEKFKYSCPLLSLTIRGGYVSVTFFAEYGVKPISEKILQPNFLMALEWKEGYIFARIVRKRTMIYKPYPLINANGATVDIPPGGHAGEYRLRDPRNTANDILYLDIEMDSGYPWILHGSIGLKPNQILMYPRFPEGQTILGKFPNIDPIQPKAGDPTGYVNSDYSPYDNPTDFIEYVIPPMQHIGFEFYNRDTEYSHQPVLHIYFALYHFQILAPTPGASTLQNRLIRQIASRQVPAAFLTVGYTSSPLPMGERLMAAWGVKPINLDEALKLEG